MLKHILVSLCCMVLFCPARSGSAESLDIFYFEYPPYYHQLENQAASGIIVDIARRVFAAAGVEPAFSFMPAKRILHELHGVHPAASLGWFKTPEREQYALFSLPIYVNRPVVAFFLRENESRFSPYATLEGVLQSGQFVLGRVQGFSEGAELDAMLERYRDKTVQVASDSVRLLKMLESRRFDFMLIAPEEADTLLEAAQAPMEKFTMRAMSDIPQGNLRYIMYSRAVPQNLIRRIDEAILAEIGTLPQNP